MCLDPLVISAVNANLSSVFPASCLAPPQITVRNARDPTRFVVVKGFCRSASLVHEVVREVTVFRGGEVLQVEQSLRPQSLSEQLRMKVALPRAFGVPPEVDALLQALSSAGGVVDSQNLGWVFTRN